MRAEGTIYPGQQSGRGGEEETGTAEAGERAGARTKTLNVYDEELLAVALTAYLL